MCTASSMVCGYLLDIFVFRKTPETVTLLGAGLMLAVTIMAKGSAPGSAAHRRPKGGLAVQCVGSLRQLGQLRGLRVRHGGNHGVGRLRRTTQAASSCCSAGSSCCGLRMKRALS